jgi:hypothetical protein
LRVAPKWHEGGSLVTFLCFPDSTIPWHAKALAMAARGDSQPYVENVRCLLANGAAGTRATLMGKPKGRMELFGKSDIEHVAIGNRAGRRQRS